MNAITEMVDAEAKRAEAEEPVPEPAADPDATPEPEPEPEPEGKPEPEPTPPAPEPTTADIHALEKELDRHWKKVPQIMGADFAMFVPCPTCEEAQTPLAGLIPVGAMAPTPQYERRQDTEPCPDCKALGLMVTGSKVPGQDLLPCPRCLGAGYTQKAIAPPAQLPAPANVTFDPPEVAALRAQGYTVFAPFVPAS